VRSIEHTQQWEASRSCSISHRGLYGSLWPSRSYSQSYGLSRLHAGGNRQRNVNEDEEKLTNVSLFFLRDVEAGGVASYSWAFEE